MAHHSASQSHDLELNPFPKAATVCASPISLSLALSSLLVTMVRCRVPFFFFFFKSGCFLLGWLSLENGNGWMDGWMVCGWMGPRGDGASPIDINGR